MTALMQAQAANFDFKGSYLRSKTNEFQSPQQMLPSIQQKNIQPSIVMQPLAFKH